MDLISRLRRRQHHPHRRAVAVGGRVAGHRGRLEAGGVRRRRGFRRLRRTNGPSQGVAVAVVAAAVAVVVAVVAVVAVAAVVAVVEPAVVGEGGGRRRGGGISDLLLALEVLFGL